jgi:hypothetical protein
MVNVSTVNWEFSGPTSCWGSASGHGTRAASGATFTISIPLSYTASVHAAANCTVEAESVTTPGFTFVDANTPLVVDSGATQTLKVTLLAPDSNETTALTLSGLVTNSSKFVGTTVNVSGVNWLFSGAPACWASTTGPGTHVAGNQTFAVTVTLSYTAVQGGSQTCTVRSVHVTTGGFKFVSANTPLYVASGGSQTLDVVVRAPDTNVTTVLSIDGNVTSASSSTTVNVTAVNWDFTDSSTCWNSMTSSGAVVSGGQNFTVKVSLSYTAGLLGPGSCTVESESVGTSGFTYIGADTPLVVDSGSTQTLSVTVEAPWTNETTVLTLDGQVTSS